MTTRASVPYVSRRPRVSQLGGSRGLHAPRCMPSKAWHRSPCTLHSRTLRASGCGWWLCCVHGHGHAVLSRVEQLFSPPVFLDCLHLAAAAGWCMCRYYLFPTTANRVFLRKGPRGAVGTSQLLHEDDDVEGQSSDGSDLSDSDGPDVGAGAGAGAGYDAGVDAPMARDQRVTSRLPVMPESEELAHL